MISELTAPAVETLTVKASFEKFILQLNCMANVNTKLNKEKIEDFRHLREDPNYVSIYTLPYYKGLDDENCKFAVNTVAGLFNIHPTSNDSDIDITTSMKSLYEIFEREYIYSHITELTIRNSKSMASELAWFFKMFRLNRSVINWGEMLDICYRWNEIEFRSALKQRMVQAGN